MVTDDIAPARARRGSEQDPHVELSRCAISTYSDTGGWTARGEAALLPVVGQSPFQLVCRLHAAVS
jgi:hypothetical protein